jgi:thiazole synthase
MWRIDDVELTSRLLLGTARYPSPDVMRRSVEESGVQIITVSLRREAAGGSPGRRFWDYLRELNVRILPNTAGCHTVKEAVATAHMARDLFETPWIKLEVIGDDYTLQPDPFGLVEAAKILCAEGFVVLPYTTTDLIVAERLLAAGCQVLMPWGAPIGSGRGLADPLALKTLRRRFPAVPLIVDAGIGKPSHAAQAMELGYDAVLLNTAVACAHDPVTMARAFKLAVAAGRAGYEAGTIPERETATPSTSLIDRPFHAALEPAAEEAWR